MPIGGGPAEPSPNGPYAVRDNAQKMAEDLTAEFPEAVYWIQPEFNDCTLSTIVRAIAERSVLAFGYHGQPRVVSPHALGRVQPDNKLILHAFQTSGEAAHGSVPCWGYFRVDEIEDLETVEATFRPQLDYKCRFTNIIQAVG